MTAISSYKLTHTPQQTEQTVRAWYDRYDEMLAAAIQQNADIRALRAANVSNGCELCQRSQDYHECQARQMAEAHRTIRLSKRGITIIQYSFEKVRSGLSTNNPHYDWFKIQTTNNIEKY